MFQVADEKTIIAQCSPVGQGAIALIRLSGVDAFSIADKLSLLKSSTTLSFVAARTIHYGWVIDEHGKQIDQVLFLAMKAPSTFTGQDTIEITCHNNQYIIEAIIRRAIEFGARLAQSGEFTKRALIEGKIDLLQAEAVHDLLTAQTERGVQLALAQVQGSLSEWVKQLEGDVIKAGAFINASFEFLDEEVNFQQEILQLVDSVINKITHIKEQFDQQRHILEGVRIALVGAVNVGKSSLFNTLLGQDRAIVTPVAGTTRDVIEAHVSFAAIHCTLIDTAGIRATKDVVESQGVIRSHQEARKADIVLFVFDGSRAVQEHERQLYHDLRDLCGAKMLSVCTKIDLEYEVDGKLDEAALMVSTKTLQYMPELKHQISERVKHVVAQCDSPYLLNKRHYAVLTALYDDLIEVRRMLLSKPIAYELVAYHIQKAIEDFGQLTGKTVNEKMFDEIFSQFCVGK